MLAHLVVGRSHSIQSCIGCTADTLDAVMAKRQVHRMHWLQCCFTFLCVRCRGQRLPGCVPRSCAASGPACRWLQFAAVQAPASLPLLRGDVMAHVMAHL